MRDFADWILDELLSPMAETRLGELMARAFCLLLVFALGVVIGCNL